MIDYEINTYWNVETLYLVFNAVSAMMGSGDYSALLKMLFFMGLIIGMFVYATSNKQIEVVKWLLQSLVLVSLLNLPIARITLVDKTGIEAPKVVSNVPWMMATVADVTNNISNWTSEKYENMVLIPSELGIAKGDLAFGHKVLQHVNKATIADPALKADLIQFFKECTLYDVNDGVIKPQDLVQGTGVWEMILNPANTNPARFVTHGTMTGNPQTKPCTEVASLLKIQVEAANDAAMKFYGKQMFNRVASDEIAKGMFLSSISITNSWLIGTSANASDSMKQAMFNNIWREAGSELPILLNDPARVAQVSAMAGVGQAAQKAAASQNIISSLAKETLPHMRNWIEAILIAMFPLVLVMILVSPANASRQILSGYFMGFFWIALWPVMFAIINSFSLMLLKKKFVALGLASQQGVPFQLTDAFSATITDELAFVGWMVILVPFLSGAVVKLGQMGIMSMGDKMMASFSSSGASVGGDLSAGNMSMGNRNLDTTNSNSTSMGSYNANTQMASGNFMMMDSQGTTSIHTPSGNVAQQALSNATHTSGTVGTSYSAGSSVTGTRGTTGASIAGSGSRTSAALSTSQGRTTSASRRGSQGRETSASTSVTGENTSAVDLSTRVGSTDGTTREEGTGKMYTDNLGVHAGVNGGLGGVNGGNSGTGTGTGTGVRSGKGRSGDAASGGAGGTGVSAGATASTNHAVTASASEQTSSGQSTANDSSQTTGYRVSKSGGFSQQNQVGEETGQEKQATKGVNLANSREYDSSNRIELTNSSGVSNQGQTEQRQSFQSGYDFTKDPKFTTAAFAFAAASGNYGSRNPNFIANNASEAERSQIMMEYAAHTGQTQSSQQMPSGVPASAAEVGKELPKTSNPNLSAQYDAEAQKLFSNSQLTPIVPSMATPPALAAASAANLQASDAGDPNSIVGQAQSIQRDVRGNTAVPIAEVPVIDRASELRNESVSKPIERKVDEIHNGIASAVGEALSPPPNSGRAALGNQIRASEQAAIAAEKKNREYEERQSK